MKNLRVYIVDDDEDDRMIFCEVLNHVSDNVSCTMFTNGKDVLQNLETATKLPDYIFLDLNMPRLNGRQCLKLIRQNKEFSQVPVIIYSTSKLTEDIVDTKTLGADYYISKPSNLETLKKELEFVLNNKWME